MGSGPFYRCLQQGVLVGLFMANQRRGALLLMWLMVLAPMSGCFGENEASGVTVDALAVEEADSLQGGMWQQITLTAKEDVAVYIPYFVQDPGSLRAQNGTVLDVAKGEAMVVDVLFPPRNEDVVLFLGEFGRIHWPIRAANQSWMSWLENMPNTGAVEAVPNQDEGGVWPWLIRGTPPVATWSRSS